jgi:transposase
MEAKAGLYIPSAFRSFQGFDVVDIKEFRTTKVIEIVLGSQTERKHICWRCGDEQGHKHDEYRVRAKHVRMMGWQVWVVFFREKRYCGRCDKVRSEAIEFLCPTSPHITMELAWWLNRLTEITSVLAVSELESIDKETCYQIDKYILKNLLQGYKIPKVTHISVDEVYARSPRQLKEGEDRDDLFLTVVVDHKTHKVIWVSQSRKKEALDEFFALLGDKACKQMQVVACDQHRGYAASVAEHCTNATLVWDKFHLIQQFNEALNEDRRQELEAMDPEGRMAEEIGDLMNNKYRYIYMTRSSNRTLKDQRHIEEVARLNQKISQLEMIKEHFHKMFDCRDEASARVMLAELYQWAMECNAFNIWKWVKSIKDHPYFWNYFKHRFTTGVSEGINRVIKGLKWQAYGYKDMFYFALKILQKAGYLNSQYHFKILHDSI